MVLFRPFDLPDTKVEIPDDLIIGNTFLHALANSPMRGGNNDKDTIYKSCNIKIILDGEERGKDLVSFNKNGNIKLATQVSRTNFLNTLKKSLV